MSKHEDEARELIELVAANSHHHAAKSFGGRTALAKGGMLDAKVAETSMLLDKIKKLTEAHNLDPPRNIWGTRDQHLSPPVFPEWLHHHRQYHLQHLQLTPS